jgi:hypothetical protein
MTVLASGLELGSVPALADDSLPPPALAAVPAPCGAEYEVVPCVRMPFRAVRLCGHACAGHRRTAASPHVFRGSHGFEMRRVHAPGHSTQVVYLKADRYGANNCFEGKSMSGCPLLYPVVDTDVVAPISVVVGIAMPRPASGGRVGNDLAPEAPRKALVAELHGFTYEGVGQ